MPLRTGCRVKRRRGRERERREQWRLASAPRPKPKPRKRAQVISARITSVVDGDTTKVRAFGTKRRFYTVRLIGIDTPRNQEARHSRRVRRQTRQTRR